MKLIKPSNEIITEINGDEILKHIELCGRVCYKSEHKITEDSAKKFVKSLIDRGHESVLEHYNITVRFICDRGISHEIVRHRAGCSYSQESTRFCRYDKGEMTFVKPFYISDDDIEFFKEDMESVERKYSVMLHKGYTPQQARAILPNSLKTELIMTANLRAWRHFLKLRTDKSAHPQMRELTIPLLKKLKELIPIVFDDIEVKE